MNKKLSNLTHAEEAVVKLLAKGLPNKLIAHELGISESTVKVHVRTVLRNWGINNRQQAIFYYLNLLTKEDRLKHISEVIDAIVAKWPEERRNALYKYMEERNGTGEQQPCEFRTGEAKAV